MGGHLKNDDALLLAKALENNSALIELIFLGQIDENIETQLMYLKMRLYQVMSKRNSIWVCAITKVMVSILITLRLLYTFD